MSESQVPSRDAAELLESVVELGLPSSRRAVVPAHRRRRHAFRQFAQDTARGEVTVPPTLLSPAQRKLHIRDTVIEDHLLRMRLVPSAVSDKLRALAQDPFTFFRGTALLYYRDIAGTDAHLPFAPTVGDVHPENFGILPGGDGQPLFDLNDMDEAWAAPFTWDLQRGAVGFALAAGQLGAGQKRKRRLPANSVRAIWIPWACARVILKPRRCASGPIMRLRCCATLLPRRSVVAVNS